MKKAVLICVILSFLIIPIVGGSKIILSIEDQKISQTPRDIRIEISGDVCYKNVDGTYQIYATKNSVVNVSATRIGSCLCQHYWYPIVNLEKEAWGSGKTEIADGEKDTIALLKGDRLQTYLRNTGGCSDGPHDDYPARAIFSGDAPECGVCPEKQKLDGYFKATIDVKEKDDWASKDIVLKSNEDVSFELSIKSPEALVYFVEDNAPVEEKYKCSLPEYFEIEIKIGAWYYDNYGFFENLNVYDFINRSRNVMKNVSSILNYFVSESGNDYNAYFFSDTEIFDMIGHHVSLVPFVSADDSILLEEKINIKVELVNDNEIRLYIKDSVVGSPAVPDVYEKDYKNGKLNKNKIREGQPIVISKGDFSLFLYAGLISKFTQELPKIADEDMFNKNASEPIKNKKGEIIRIVYRFPRIHKNTLGNLLNFSEIVKKCCKSGDVPEIPKIEIEGICPAWLKELYGNLWVEFDAIPVNYPSYMEYRGDGSLKVELRLKDISYDKSNKDFIYSNFKCGVPKELKLTMYLEGNYYDDILKNLDFFSRLRSRTLETFPPQEIKYLFEKQRRINILIDQSEVEKKISEGNVEWWGDDSQRIYEMIELTVRQEGGVIYVYLLDEIIPKPMSIRHSSGARLEYPRPFSTKRNAVKILENEPASSIAFAGLVDSIVKSVYALKEKSEFNNVFIPPTDGEPVEIFPDSRFFFEDLQFYTSIRKSQKCCYKKEQEAEKTSDGTSTNSEEQSVYYLRDKDNYQVSGIAYLIGSDKAIAKNITKTFITNLSNDYHAIYKLEDEELNFCNYSVLGEKEYYANTGKFLSHDELFELEIGISPDTNISIKTINITQCGIYKLDNLEIEDWEVEEEKIDLLEVILSAKDYTKGLTYLEEVLFKIYDWIGG